ncbi:MarR family transcriptional regulator [Leptolyngbya sp. KIOST-1]|uniref:MarR family transcriptional regulator n=1 Tax=Leptolyngbya sp. KIOST-1 TaxID=1229172 RepID=UPI00069210FA|nr:MarR family transcriptional regulator [Leptolyngbya sp. KIOST-1]
MLTQKIGNQGVSKKPTLLHYRLTLEEWLRACCELKPSEKNVLYYLRTLDPFGERDLDIGVREMARELRMNPSTVSRALKELDRKEWIDMEITSARVKLHSQQANCGEVLSSGNSVALTQQANCEKVLSLGNSVAPGQQVLSPRNDLDRHATPGAENGEPVEIANPLSSKGFSNFEFSTECTSSVLNTLKKEQIGTAYSNSVETNREGIGKLLEKIEAAGIRTNPAIEKTLASIYQSNPDKAAERVRNAISAFLEQRTSIHKPQAFLNAALKRGFTSNEAKHRTTQNSQNRSEEPNVPPPVLDLSDLLVAIDIECSRLGITPDEATQRLGDAFGWESRPFEDLTSKEDLELLHTAMVGWS